MPILAGFLAATGVFFQSVDATPPSFEFPKVHPDRTVEFRLTAPGARKVALQGEWMARGSNVPMNKLSGGSWSLRLGPLSPDLYLYAFEVDGLRVPDPLNRNVRNGYPELSSLLEVPGAGSRAIPEVPHGTMHTHYYPSRVTDSVRRLHVYVPRDYSRFPGRIYPVLVLLQGSWDDDSAWSQVGRVGVILDNLLAGRKALPMVVVMPDGHPYPSFDVATRPANLELLRRDLIEEVRPLIERNYRVGTSRRQRAIAGLSMGGSQALHLGLTMEQFGSIGAFSAPADIPNGRTFQAVLQAAPRALRKFDLLWLGCGRDDPYFSEAEGVHTALQRDGVVHTWRPTDGEHNWMAWRRHFEEFAALLFQRRRM
jgi:enterochelin esterase family protein